MIAKKITRAEHVVAGKGKMFNAATGEQVTAINTNQKLTNFACGKPAKKGGK